MTKRERAPSPNPQVEEEPKAPASFGGALSRFAFAGTSRQSRGSSGSSSASKLAETSATKLSAPIRPTATGAASPTPPSPSSSPSPRKPKRKKPKHAGYAPPAKYAHLSGIPDVLAPNLIVIFIGLNPGLATARSGHAFSSPSNGFWRLLHSSGITPDRRLAPAEHLNLPELYSLGRTDLVMRPTKDQAELSRQEMVDSVPALEAKISSSKPEAVCVVGKGIWESIAKAQWGKRLRKDEFGFGWQEEEFGGARVFVAIGTSGLVAGYSPKQKEDVFGVLGDWVQERRRARGETAPKSVGREVVEAKARERLEEFKRGFKAYAEDVGLPGEEKAIPEEE